MTGGQADHRTPGRGTPAERLRQLGAELERAVAGGEPLKYSALNHELHRLIREMSGQAVAAALPVWGSGQARYLGISHFETVT